MDRKSFFTGLVSKTWEHIVYCEDKQGRKVAIKSVGKTGECAHTCYVSENKGPWTVLKDMDLFETIKEDTNHDK